MAFAEAFNKIIGKLLTKFVLKSQRDWDDKLGECLWAYRTTVRSPTKATQFFLVYGCKDPDLISMSCLDNQDGRWKKYRLRLQKLEVLDDKRLQA